jgi:hypothetical protein
MLGLHCPRRRGRGAAAVEFALVLPFLVLLLVGVWEVGRMIQLQQILANAAREGAREAAGSNLTVDQVEQVVISYIQSAGLPTANVQVTVENQTHPSPSGGGDPLQNAVCLDQLKVTVSIPYADVQQVKFYVVDADVSALLTGEAVWTSTNDAAYPTPTGPPSPN